MARVICEVDRRYMIFPQHLNPCSHSDISQYSSSQYGRNLSHNKKQTLLKFKPWAPIMAALRRFGSEEPAGAFFKTRSLNPQAAHFEFGQRCCSTCASSFIVLKSCQQRALWELGAFPTMNCVFWRKAATHPDEACSLLKEVVKMQRMPCEKTFDNFKPKRVGTKLEMHMASLPDGSFWNVMKMFLHRHPRQ